MSASFDWTFAYGSNMDVDDLQAWFMRNGYTAARVERMTRAELADHRLVWNYRSKSRRGGAANVEPAPGNTLHGVALLVNAGTLAALDKKEGHPRSYSRGAAKVSIKLDNKSEVDAWLYVALPSRCEPTTVPPTRDYLEIIIRAATRVGLPAEHIAMLHATPTVEGA